MEQRPNPFHSSPQKRSRSRGFTLVELLVVIVIIAVLAAIAIFATRGIRKKALQVNAVSSMRQVATFCVAYSTENNGDINTLKYTGDPKEGKPDWVKNTFWGRLQPYMFPDAAGSGTQLKRELDRRIASLFNTSSVSKGKWPGTIFNKVTVYHDTSGCPLPFAFNQNLVSSYWNKFPKISSFDDPSQTLYGTFGYFFFNEADGKAYEPMPVFPATPRNNIYYFDDKTTPAWFLDGHVEILNPPIAARRF